MKAIRPHRVFVCLLFTPANAIIILRYNDYRKGIWLCMGIIRYTRERDFVCLEDLPGTSSELTLVHVGQENCKPYHIFSGKKDEYVIHFITAGRGFYSANGKAWTLCAGQMFLIYPGETVVYCSDSAEPWSYSWIGFRGFKAETILK